MRSQRRQEIFSWLGLDGQDLVPILVSTAHPKPSKWIKVRGNQYSSFVYGTHAHQSPSKLRHPLSRRAVSTAHAPLQYLGARPFISLRGNVQFVCVQIVSMVQAERGRSRQQTMVKHQH